MKGVVKWKTLPAAPEKEGLLAFKEQENNENVKRWIDRFVISLYKQIEREKIMEERDGF